MTRVRWPAHGRRVVAVEVTTAIAATVGGALLAAKPDGALLRADPAALADSPFEDWRMPGLLLATLVGGGYALTATANVRGWPWARSLASAAGAGLILFEAFEVVWIGPQPLEAIFAGVGAYVLMAALRTSRC